MAWKWQCPTLLCDQLFVFSVIVLSLCLSSIFSTSSSHVSSYEGLVLADILKPELIMPLLEMLPVQERLSSHLPEVCPGFHCFLYSTKMSIHAILSLLGLSFENVIEEFSQVVNLWKVTGIDGHWIMKLFRGRIVQSVAGW